MSKAKYIPAVQAVGKTFGRLTVNRIEYRSGRAFCVCSCECGRNSVVLSSRLWNGHTVSCGCFRRELAASLSKTHGKSKTGAYSSWLAMKHRCMNPNGTDWDRYGGRGIKVCERWNRFENFLADMGERPNGMEIDRKDNDGNYEPGNCRWATRTEQNRNSSRTHKLTVGDETLSVSEWAERTGIKARLILARLARGWTAERAATSPIQKRWP